MNGDTLFDQTGNPRIGDKAASGTCDPSGPEDAVRLFEKASKLLHGTISGGVPDPEEAMACYLQAVAAGSVDAMIALGNLYEEKEDFERTYYWYLEAAAAGSPAGMLNVAWMYHAGCYVEQDYAKAKAYFTQLFDQNIKLAAFYLGLYAERGYGGPVDESGAVRYYTEGMKQGDPLCANNLGVMYCQGRGVKKDPAGGFRLFQEAYNLCKAGKADSSLCANLAQCYEKGYGTEKDLHHAFQLYREGAEQGCKACEEKAREAAKRIGGKEARS